MSAFTDAAEVILAAVDASLDEHAYAVEAERWTCELGDRVAETFASTDDPIVHLLIVVLRARKASRPHEGKDAQ